MADKPTPLPCPFCGELLTHKTHRTGLDTDIWEHPRSAGCPLSEVGIGDPISIFDVQSDIAAWNKRTTPPEARPAPAHELVGYMSQARCFVHKHEVTEVEAQLYGWIPVYTPPAAQREWVGLADYEIKLLSGYDLNNVTLIVEVQRKLKEKNT